MKAFIEGWWFVGFSFFLIRVCSTAVGMLFAMTLFVDENHPVTPITEIFTVPILLISPSRNDDPHSTTRIYRAAESQWTVERQDLDQAITEKQVLNSRTPAQFRPSFATRWLSVTTSISFTISSPFSQLVFLHFQGQSTAIGVVELTIKWMQTLKEDDSLSNTPSANSSYFHTLINSISAPDAIGNVLAVFFDDLVRRNVVACKLQYHHYDMCGNWDWIAMGDFAHIHASQLDGCFQLTSHND